MPDSKYFGIPFGASGDRATIPEATQAGGGVSYQQGFGPDYERNPANDPLAKRVPRPGTNEYLYQITNALKFLQLYGLPEWYQVDDAGNRVSYPLLARVRNGNAAYVSLIANNLATPGTDPASWALDEAFSVAAVEATLAQMLAGTDATKLATPRRVASSVQRGQWNYGVAAGTANALTVSLSPAPAALTAGFTVALRITTTNTGGATLNVNGLGAAPIVGADGQALNGSDLLAGTVVSLVYTGAAWVFAGRTRGGLLNTQVFLTPGTATYTPSPGVRTVEIEVQGGGGAGGGAQNPGASMVAAGAGGGGGGYARSAFVAVASVSGATVTVGAGGARNVGGAGGPGGTSSVGSLISATGGGGGTLGSPRAVQNGGEAAGAGAAGVGTGGFLDRPGDPGDYAFYATNPVSGAGGGSFFGSGGSHVDRTNGGNGGRGKGGGGSGAALQANSNTDAGGGGGAPGIVVIREYT